MEKSRTARQGDSHRRRGRCCFRVRRRNRRYSFDARFASPGPNHRPNRLPDFGSSISEIATLVSRARVHAGRCGRGRSCCRRRGARVFDSHARTPPRVSGVTYLKKTGITLSLRNRWTRWIRECSRPQRDQNPDRLDSCVSARKRRVPIGTAIRKGLPG